MAKCIPTSWNPELDCSKGIFIVVSKRAALNWCIDHLYESETNWVSVVIFIGIWKFKVDGRGSDTGRSSVLNRNRDSRIAAGGERWRLEPG